MLSGNVNYEEMVQLFERLRQIPQFARLFQPLPFEITPSIYNYRTSVDEGSNGINDLPSTFFLPTVPTTEQTYQTPTRNIATASNLPSRSIPVSAPIPSSSPIVTESLPPYAPASVTGQVPYRTVPAEVVGSTPIRTEMIETVMRRPRNAGGIFPLLGF